MCMFNVVFLAVFHNHSMVVYNTCVYELKLRTVNNYYKEIERT